MGEFCVHSDVKEKAQLEIVNVNNQIALIVVCLMLFIQLSLNCRNFN